jgi:hypothetical protein
MFAIPDVDMFGEKLICGMTMLKTKYEQLPRWSSGFAFKSSMGVHLKSFDKGRSC